MSQTGPAQKTIGSYKLLARIGEGGMARVFKAEHMADRTVVALKVFRSADIASPDFLKRVKREIATLKQCAHPNIVKVHAYSLSGKIGYVALHYIDGENIDEVVAREGPLPMNRILKIAKDVGGALAYCHARGLFHRDIKPANIMIERGSGRAILLDFGIVKATHMTDISVMNQVRGTLIYMAPEQFLNQSVDGRTDIYQLGLVLVKAATGHEPFDMSQLMQMADLTGDRPIPSIREKSPDFPETGEMLIQNCLYSKREDRYSSAHDFLADVEKVAQGKPIAPRSDRRKTLRMERVAFDQGPVTSTLKMDANVSKDLRALVKRKRSMRTAGIVAAVVLVLLVVVFALRAVL